MAGLGNTVSFELGSFYTRDLTAYGFAITNLSLEEIRAVNGRVNEALAAGVLRPLVAEVLPLREAARAHQLVEAGKVEGKIVLVP